MQRVTFTNSRGDSIELYQSPFFLNKIEGLGDVNADVQKQKAPGQDGSTYIDALFEERHIPIEVVILEDLLTNRQFISKVFNPKLGEGTLTYENDMFTRSISAVPEHVPTFEDVRPRKTQMVVIDLICPNPFWKSDSDIQEPMFESLFQFPFEGIFQMGIQRDQRTITNAGDTPSPIYVEFYGPATNPVITNSTTGEFIKVKRTLLEGEYMRIDTTDGNKSVDFVSSDGTVTNVFNWIDLNSSFFKLVVGDNLIVYSADSNIQGAVVNITYNTLYNAV
jgi:hypothetical protein